MVFTKTGAGIVRKLYPLNLPSYRTKDSHQSDNRIVVKTLEGIYIITTKDIIRLEASSNYCQIILMNGKTITISKTLKYLAEKLSSNSFLRVHSKNLVNLSFIVFFDIKQSELLLSNGDRISVSRTKKNDLLDWINLLDQK